MTKPILIIQNVDVEGPGTILEWLAERHLPHSLVHTYQGDVLPDIDAIEATICLGCPHSAAQYYEHDYLSNLFAWVSRVVRENRPYLGLCFGGQLLANVLGAKVEPGNAREIGTYRATLSDEGMADPIFAGFGREFDMFHWHNDTFRTPFGGIHLASDSVWKHQAFRKDRQIGLQFHLEPRPEDVKQWCKVYAHEAQDLGRTGQDILTEFESVFEGIKSANFRLLDNWLG